MLYVTFPKTTKIECFLSSSTKRISEFALDRQQDSALKAHSGSHNWAYSHSCSEWCKQNQLPSTVLSNHSPKNPLSPFLLIPSRFVLYVIYYPPYKKASAAVHNLNMNIVLPSQSFEWSISVLFAKIVLAHFVVCVLITAILLHGDSSGTVNGEPISTNGWILTWAGFLGTTGILLAMIQYIPQIIWTFVRKVNTREVQHRLWIRKLDSKNRHSPKRFHFVCNLVGRGAEFAYAADPDTLHRSDDGIALQTNWCQLVNMGCLRCHGHTPIHPLGRLCSLLLYRRGTRKTDCGC